MTNEELVIATKAARKAAHEAPMAKIAAYNERGQPTGKLFISEHTRAWADRSKEWMLLMDECERRGVNPE